MSKSFEIIILLFVERFTKFQKNSKTVESPSPLFLKKIDFEGQIKISIKLFTFYKKVDKLKVISSEVKDWHILIYLETVQLIIIIS